MPTLIALALATPIFGFALQSPIALQPPLALLPEVTLTATSVDGLEPRALVGRRDALTSVTVGLQIATAAATWIGAVLESIHFADAYGGHSDLRFTACFTGEAVMSDFCADDTPWPQTIAEAVAGSLSLTSVAVSSFVPVLGPPYALPREQAGRWRAYEVTRWIGFGMHVVQIVSGLLITNAAVWGWADPQQDFRALSDLHAAHLVFSYATAGMDTANALLLF